VLPLREHRGVRRALARSVEIQEEDMGAHKTPPCRVAWLLGLVNRSRFMNT
jgi:hypothetical protein